MTTNIKDFYEKHKYFWKVLKSEILSILVVFLVGTASFGLGMLYEKSSVDIKPTALTINDQNSIKSTSVSAESSPMAGAVIEAGVEGGEVVASKNGTKYHFPWCGGAKQISEKNKITFKSIDEARKAGYTPATNCKGLK